MRVFRMFISDLLDSIGAVRDRAGAVPGCYTVSLKIRDFQVRFVKNQIWTAPALGKRPPIRRIDSRIPEGIGETSTKAFVCRADRQ